VLEKQVEVCKVCKRKEIGSMTDAASANLEMLCATAVYAAEHAMACTAVQDITAEGKHSCEQLRLNVYSSSASSERHTSKTA
jgi:hydrogenase maturation factor HypF (carbamoyltransferase family)